MPRLDLYFLSSASSGYSFLSLGILALQHHHQTILAFAACFSPSPFPTRPGPQKSPPLTS